MPIPPLAVPLLLAPLLGVPAPPPVRTPARAPEAAAPAPVVPAPARVDQDGPPPLEVERAVVRGIEHLLARQRPEGAFSKGERSGRTALVTYTLLSSGLSARHHAVRRGLAHAQAMLEPTTYDTACLCLALAAAHRSDPDPGWLESLEAHAHLLAEMQNDQGAWGYPSGEDLSNTQYAALGLWAAAKAGVRVDEEVWLRLAEAVHDFATREEGFAYRRGGEQATGSMTAAGVGCLAICLERMGDGAAARRRRKRHEAALEAGLDWLGSHFRADRNPGSGAWLHYYLYGLERVGALTGRTHLGSHDWYAEGAARLLGTEGGDGDWGGLDDTAFALLFLRRATAPRTGETRDLAGARRDSRDGELRVVAVGDAPLRAWIAGWDPEVLRRHQWPGEEGRGPHVVRVVWLVDGVPVADVPGDPDAPAGQERFALEHEFREPGSHVLQAEAFLQAAPHTDSRGRTRPGGLRRVRSAEVPLEVQDACPEWMLELARDPARDLLREAGPRLTASSSAPRTRPEDAADGDLLTSWRCAARDEHPWLEVELERPVRADTVVVGHALAWPHRPGAHGRALEVEVSINGREPLRLRMPADARRPGRLELPRELEVRHLTLRFPWRVPSAAGDASIGVDELGLQRRGRARSTSDSR